MQSVCKFGALCYLADVWFGVLGLIFSSICLSPFPAWARVDLGSADARIQKILNIDFYETVSSPKDGAYFAQKEKDAFDLDDKQLRSDARLDLALEYAQDHRIQEAVWTLRKAGYSEAADQLESKLVSFLRAAPVVRELPLPGKADFRIKRVELPGGIEAIKRITESLTERGPHNPISELWFYCAARFFNLNLVSAVAWKSNGVDSYSIQYFVKDAEMTQVDLRGKNKVPFEFREIYFLDFISKNHDRNGTNSLRRVGSDLVAIDHGYSFRKDEEISERVSHYYARNWEEFEIDIGLPSHLSSRVLSAHFEEFKAAMQTAYMPLPLIQTTWNQITQVQKALSKACGTRLEPVQTQNSLQRVGRLGPPISLF